MNKDMVFICASASLNIGTNVIVKYAGKVIEPIIIYGTSLSNCRGILVPYGSDITFKAKSNLNYYFLPYGPNSDSYSTFLFVASNGSTTFKAVRDLFIKDVSASTNSDAPT